MRPADMRRILTGLALLTACAVCVVPFAYVVSTALKPTTTLFTYPPEWIHLPPYLGNVDKLFSETQFARWVLNSVVIASLVSAAKVIIDSMAGYALARMQFSGRRAVFASLLITVMVPSTVLIIPLYFLVLDLGLFDTYWALLLPPLANPVGIFMMWGYIRALPPELEQAAEIDNAGPFTTYWRVILPLVKPGLVMVAMYTFLVQYISFAWPLVATESESVQVITTGLSSLKPVFGVEDWGLTSAASVLAIVPIAATFYVLQYAFKATNAATALKE